MLLTWNMPTEYWAEAVAYVICILNRCYISREQDSTRSMDHKKAQRLTLQDLWVLMRTSRSKAKNLYCVWHSIKKLTNDRILTLNGCKKYRFRVKWRIRCMELGEQHRRDAWGRTKASVPFKKPHHRKHPILDKHIQKIAQDLNGKESKRTIWKEQIHYTFFVSLRMVLQYIRMP